MSQLANLKVLIADDHLLIRQFVRNALQESKITNVQTAADGNEAIDLVQKAFEAGQPYDMVFLDWNMPTISGLGSAELFPRQGRIRQYGVCDAHRRIRTAEYHESHQSRSDVLHHQAGLTFRFKQETF